MKSPWRGKGCAVCGKTHGYFQRATYEGAPDGGVSVHQECLPEFWRKIEREQWNREFEAEYYRCLATRTTKSVT